MRTYFPMTALAVSLFVAGTAFADDKDLIQGTWEITSVEFNGRVLPEGPELQRFQETKLTFQGEAVINSLEKDIRGRFVLDGARNPPALDIITTKRKVDRKMLYAYQLQGDSLLLCFTRNSDTLRPRVLGSANGQFVLILKRQKPPEK